MADDQGQVKRLFEAALEKAPSERDLFMEGLGSADPDLRKKVESLLVAEVDVDSVTVEKSTAIRPLSPDTKPADRSGPYHILREIGEGGMGVVYEAHQEGPVRRNVALKLIKWGMDTKAVVARFESERQALALMNHPNIASVYDAGATPEGRPYFAMEYVQGIPITEYCDKHRLTIKERLELFIQVCEGVQHAHQKGIIHRDIKPSNVLVAVQDDKPVPKIIDFGVAKATSQRLTELTVATELGQLIGTPEYMSPEQAEMTNLDIDTRTDVYSLGVLLYELLVGAQPFDPRELRAAGLVEIQRKLREDEPLRPSTKVSGLGAASTTSASNRRVDVRTLERQLKGDLDWITMKALEKDRTRRYETANAFALDLQRYQANEPVRARPPSSLYRFASFARRNRREVVAATAFLTLALGFAVTYSLNVTTARDRANQEALKAQAINDFMQKTLAAANPLTGDGRNVTVVQALDKAVGGIETSFANELDVQAAIKRTIGNTYRDLGRLDDAEVLLVSALEMRKDLFGGLHPDVAESVHDLAHLKDVRGDYVQAAELYREALRLNRELGDKEDDIARILNGLAWVMFELSDYETAERFSREAIALRRELDDEQTREMAGCLNNLALIVEAQGDFEEAEKLYRRVLFIEENILGREHPNFATTMSNLGLLLSDTKGHDAAEPYLREALAIRRKALGEHPDTAVSLSVLGSVLIDAGDLAGAEGVLREALQMQRRVLGDQHMSTAASLNNLANVLEKVGKYEEAEPLYRESIAIKRNEVGDHPDLAISISNLAHMLAKKGDNGEADALHQEACSILQKIHGENHWMPAHCGSLYADFLTKVGRYDEAEARLLKSYSILRETLGHNHRRTVNAVERLVALYEAWGKPKEAAEYRALLEEAEEIQQ